MNDHIFPTGVLGHVKPEGGLWDFIAEANLPSYDGAPEHEADWLVYNLFGDVRFHTILTPSVVCNCDPETELSVAAYRVGTYSCRLVQCPVCKTVYLRNFKRRVFRSE